MKFNFQKSLSTAGGLSAGALGVKLTDKMLANLNPTVRAVGQIGLGLVAPVFLKSKPGSFVESVCDGMVAVGAYKMLENIPFLSGIAGNVGDTGYVIVQGSDLSGIDQLNQSIAGVGNTIDLED